MLFQFVIIIIFPPYHVMIQRRDKHRIFASLHQVGAHILTQFNIPFFFFGEFTFCFFRQLFFCFNNILFQCVVIKQFVRQALVKTTANQSEFYHSLLRKLRLQQIHVALVEKMGCCAEEKRRVANFQKFFGSLGTRLNGVIQSRSIDNRNAFQFRSVDIKNDAFYQRGNSTVFANIPIQRIH